MKKDFIDGLGVILTEKGLISLEDFVKIRKEFKAVQDISFEDYLIEEGIVKKNDLLKALSEHYGVPALDVVGEFFDHQHLQLFPKDVMLRHYFIPYKRTEDTDNLWVVAANPSDEHVRFVIGKFVNHHIQFMVGLPQDIKDTIREFYDESITYQPNDIENQKMERSQKEVHPFGEELKPEDDEEERIPHTWQETIDDYERK